MGGRVGETTRRETTANSPDCESGDVGGGGTGGVAGAESEAFGSPE